MSAEIIEVTPITKVLPPNGIAPDILEDRLHRALLQGGEFREVFSMKGPFHMRRGYQPLVERVPVAGFLDISYVHAPDPKIYHGVEGIQGSQITAYSILEPHHQALFDSYWNQMQQL